MTDPNRNISNIAYNYLNLPEVITTTKGNIRYVYDASGMKFRKVTTEGATITTTNYIGGFIYRNDVLQLIRHEEGRARINTANAYVFDYFLRDNVGNVRMVITDDPAFAANPILEANSFYPMGMAMAGIALKATGTLHNLYAYQGKEMQNAE